MTLKGIDVSKWQGAGLDWPAIEAAGIDFAVAKATEGTGYVDPDYAVNAERMDALPNLIPGAYAWLTPAVDQAAAAKLFVSTVGDRMKRFLAAIDVEQSGVTQKDLRAWAAAFEALTGGHPLFVYIGRNVISSWGNPRLSDLGPWWEPYYPGGSGYPGDSSPVWTTGLAGWAGPTIWQYGSASRVPNYGGSVDGDACRLTAAQLAAYTGASPLAAITITLLPNGGGTAHIPGGASVTGINLDANGAIAARVPFTAGPTGSPFHYDATVDLSPVGIRGNPFIRVTDGALAGCYLTAGAAKLDPNADPTPFSQADLDAATAKGHAAGYAAAKAKASAAVTAI